MIERYDDQQVIAAAAAFTAGDVTYDEHTPVELPPALDAEPMVARGVRLPASLDKRIREAAKSAGVPFSQLIREWIEVGLTEMDSDRTVPLSALRRAIAHAAQSGSPA